MKSSFPKEGAYLFKDADSTINLVQEVIYHIRNIRGDIGIKPEKKVSVIISTNKENIDIFEKYVDSIKLLSKSESIEFGDLKDKPEKTISAVGTGFEVFVKLEGVIDINKELDRINKEKVKLSKELDINNKKLNNPKFVDKAPSEIVQKVKDKRDEIDTKLQKLDELLNSLK